MAEKTNHIERMTLSGDAHDRQLIENVRPPAWVNPAPSGRYNLVVIGAGTAGLVSAGLAATIGARVALIERALMGGDCLNTGCVPSKGLIRAARAAYDAQAGDRFGVHYPAPPAIDFAEAMERMRRLRAQISRHDSAQRFKELGVDVYIGDGKLSNASSVEVDGARLEFDRAVIASGSRAAELPVAGLKEAGYYTSETIFTLRERPRRLSVVGAGPLGCELAQAFHRLGVEVTLINDGAEIMPREDRDAAQIVRRQMEREGIRLLTGVDVKRVERRDGYKTIVCAREGGGETAVDCDAILLGVGRRPNTEGLGLEAAGVKYSEKGVEVDDRLRTSNRRIYAAGDICSDYKFTHAADAMARIAVTNALFYGRRRASALNIPWCTYTDPEVAHVGYYEDEARRAGYRVATLTQEFDDLDRAVLDGETAGFARVHYERRSGRILGGTIVARHAGEMIGQLTLAIASGQKVGVFSSIIQPYPTQVDALKKIGDSFMLGRLTPRVRRVLERWFEWRRRI